MDPIFWLGLSILLVAISIAAVLIVAVPAIQELGRAARSVEKLFDTLHRELPPTLEALRLTGLEITELTDDMTEGVQNASKIAQNVDHSITGVKQQVQQAQVTSRSVMAGLKAAWKTLKDEPAAPTPRSASSPSAARSVLPAADGRSVRAASQLENQDATVVDHRLSDAQEPLAAPTDAHVQNRLDPVHHSSEPTRRHLYPESYSESRPDGASDSGPSPRIGESPNALRSDTALSPTERDI